MENDMYRIQMSIYNTMSMNIWTWWIRSSIFRLFYVRHTIGNVDADRILARALVYSTMSLS